MVEQRSVNVTPNFQNPIIWADVPDPDIIRVNDVYYMSSTTMHMNPGVPIMTSTDLVNWEIVTYVYDILEDGDQQTLTNKQDEYGKGSWASSLRYHDGVFYLAVASFSAGKTYIFKTNNIEKHQWDRSTLEGVYHDMSLLFDEGRVYMTYGGGDIRIIELTADATAIKEDGLSKVLIPNASQLLGSNCILPAEGSHFQKINGMYFVFLIMIPQEGGRTQLMYRSNRVDGEYEGRIALSDAGIAQGGLVDTVNGSWYALLFQDRGAVGRCPCLVDITWEDGWPIHHLSKVVYTCEQNDDFGMPNIVAADHFDIVIRSNSIDRINQDYLKRAWQWNHNPDHRFWNLSDRPSYLRLINGHIRESLLYARNTLTQRTFGPFCTGQVAVEIDNMKDGDVTGLAALQEHYGFVGIKVCDKTKYLVMVRGNASEENEIESIPLTQARIYLRMDCKFENMVDQASFYYSLDQEQWHGIGDVLYMKYTLPKHFMGYRFALFNYATKEVGGYVDFDYFSVNKSCEVR
ncbi:glycoside hydrolase 43 family protein [Amphibacillus jilinensis]|uniref:glycoside hydrolase family 43 protein n=1 Tax=Amphibacillus jilinensis TaxID=1216008 RepID=UPI0002DEB595|nr:glycoside hydrolase 43 family protein [Amphibacillus jilinensis]